MDTTQLGIVVISLTCLIPFGAGCLLTWLLIRQPGIKSKRLDRWEE